MDGGWLLRKIYDVRAFPKCIFPRATSQVTISQVTISQVTISQVASSQLWNFPSGNFPKVRLGPLTMRRRKLQWGGEALRLGWDRRPSATARTGWGPSAMAKTYLGSCRLGNSTFGKLPLGKNPLEKYITSKTRYTPLYFWRLDFVFVTYFTWVEQSSSYVLVFCVPLYPWISRCWRGI